MSRCDYVTSHDDAWKRMHGEGGLSDKADAWFAERFPESHGTSIRPFAQKMLQQLVERGYEYKTPRATKCAFHVRSLELIVKYGIDYAPDMNKVQKFHNSSLKPEIGQCFSNSWIFMEAVNEGARSKGQPPPLVYVEGMAWGYMTDAILHGWNSYGLSDTKAVDWTMYVGCQWNRYLGIPFSEEEFMELQSLVFPNEPRRPVSLFDGRYYPIIEERIHEIILKR